MNENQPSALATEKKPFASLKLRAKIVVTARLMLKHFWFYFIALGLYFILLEIIFTDLLPIDNTPLFIGQVFLIVLFLLFTPFFSAALQGLLLKDVDQATPEQRLPFFKLYLPYAPRLFFIMIAWLVPMVLFLIFSLMLIHADFLFIGSCLLLSAFIFCVPLLAILFCYLAERPTSTLLQSFSIVVQILSQNFTLWLGYALLLVLLCSPALVTGFFSGLAEAGAIEGDFLDSTWLLAAESLWEIISTVYLYFYAALCYRASNLTQKAQVNYQGNTAEDNPFENRPGK